MNGPASSSLVSMLTAASQALPTNESGLSRGLSSQCYEDRRMCPQRVDGSHSQGVRRLPGNVHDDPLAANN